MEAARRAEIADVPLLSVLAAEARTGLDGQRGGAQRLLELRPPEDDPEAFKALVQSPDALVVIGTYDDVGLAYAVAERVVRRDASAVARVDELFVQPGGRGVGVGEMVMDLVLAWAMEQGCVAVEAVALPGDRLTKNFFERFGLTARAIVVARVAALMPPRPELCVGAIAVNDGRLLLVQRGRPPGEGLWSVPGGRVEAGESIADAVRRELAEETGLAGTCGELVGWVERRGADHHFVILDFHVAIDDPSRSRPGDDATDVAWVPVADLGGRTDLVPGLVEFLLEHGVVTRDGP